MILVRTSVQTFRGSAPVDTTDVLWATSMLTIGMSNLLPPNWRRIRQALTAFYVLCFALSIWLWF